jgi:hypothetical protein
MLSALPIQPSSKSSTVAISIVFQADSSLCSRHRPKAREGIGCLRDRLVASYDALDDFRR